MCSNSLLWQQLKRSLGEVLIICPTTVLERLVLFVDWGRCSAVCNILARQYFHVQLLVVMYRFVYMYTIIRIYRTYTLLNFCTAYFILLEDHCCHWSGLILVWLLGEAVAAEIIQLLTGTGIPLGHCVGQAYDGASNMSRKNAGAAAIIMKESPCAIYTHCISQQLNLALIKSCTSMHEKSKSLWFSF